MFLTGNIPKEDTSSKHGKEAGLEEL